MCNFHVYTFGTASSWIKISTKLVGASKIFFHTICFQNTNLWQWQVVYPADELEHNHDGGCHSNHDASRWRHTVNGCGVTTVCFTGEDTAPVQLPIKLYLVHQTTVVYPTYFSLWVYITVIHRAVTNYNQIGCWNWNAWQHNRKLTIIH